MQYETITYVPLKPGFGLRQLLPQLPPEIARELVEDERLVYINIESHKTDVIRYFDTHFNIGVNEDLLKKTFLEVDKEEIDNFDFFIIDPNALEGGRYIFCTESRPTCQSESCPVGAELIGPVRLKLKKAKKIGIASVGRLWAVRPELLISVGLKRIFEEEGITGLCDYEQCMMEPEGVIDTGETVPVYMAKVEHQSRRLAKDIYARRYHCRQHNMPSALCLVEPYTYRSELVDCDFQHIDRVVVNGRTYWYRRAEVIVSRRLLKLLLKRDIKGLRRMTFFLNEKFLPLVVS